MADKRFEALSSDPRYRIPSRGQNRTAVDPRFKRLFTDQEFRKKATVDRYGRKIKPESGKKDLEKLYRLEKADKVERTDVAGRSEDDHEEDGVEDEVAVKSDPARDGGFSGSDSSEEEDSESEGSEEEAELAEETAGHEQTEQVPMGEVARRIACVNLDWDHIRAADIMAVASSFVPVDGKIESVTVYPSEFGQERIQREELEGPPREIFASTKRRAEQEDDEDSEDEDDEEIKRKLQQEQVGDGSEFDTAKLRQYQLERLRYFYAVIECSSKSTSKALYDNMDGREYLSTSNFFDLRFIPDSVSFSDDTPRDSCTALPIGYKPNEFRTEALTHSKVRLTWDDDDTTRKEVQKRAFSRAEMDENDLQAYIGSESSDADSVSSRKSAAEDRKRKRKEAERVKMRAALGLSEEPMKSKSKATGKEEVVGDMQITFTSGVGAGDKEGKQSVFENEPQDEESTRARYIRKEKERKQKRKEKAKSARGGSIEEPAQDEEDRDKDLGFDDPFFMDPAASTAAEKKKAKKSKLEKSLALQSAQEEDLQKKRADLELLMTADDNEEASGVRHFDMREIEKAEKDSRRKAKRGKKKDKGKKQVEQGADVDQFQLETKDPRFSALFESHEFAIDPSNPRFKGTEGMKALLEEGRRKRKGGDEVEDADADADAGRKEKRKKQKGGDDELKGLMKRLKK